MIVAERPVEPMFVDTYSSHERQVVSGALPFSTLGHGQRKWPNSMCLQANWKGSWAELDARSNLISTVHRTANKSSAGATVLASSGMTASTMMARAQTITGLSLKDLAIVYGVSRQTLYNYKKETDHPNGANWKRLQQIDEKISILARILPVSPGALAKRFSNRQGETLLSLLQQEETDIEQLKALASQLAEQMNSAAPVIQHQATLDELTRHC